MDNKLNFLLILTCLFGLLFPLNINAQATDSNSSDSSGTTSSSSSSLTPHEIVAGALLIITGIIFCFFGRRIYRLTLFLIGFYAGTIIAWIALTNGEPSGGFGPASETIILLVSLAAGLLVGSIFVCCSNAAIWLLGALSGYTLALFILSWKSGGLIESKAGRIIFIIVLTMVGLLLACFFENTIIIFGTAFIGAYAIILGIDLFAKTGFSDSVGEFLDGNHGITYSTSRNVYLMLAGMVALFIIGSIVQYRYYRTTHFGPGDGSVIPEKKWRGSA